MSAIIDRSTGKKNFVRNFKNYMEGNYNFQEWFEKHKKLEKRFGDQPWPGPEEFYPATGGEKAGPNHEIPGTGWNFTLNLKAGGLPPPPRGFFPFPDIS